MQSSRSAREVVGLHLAIHTRTGMNFELAVLQERTGGISGDEPVDQPILMKILTHTSLLGKFLGTVRHIAAAERIPTGADTLHATYLTSDKLGESLVVLKT